MLQKCSYHIVDETQPAAVCIVTLMPESWPKGNEQPLVTLCLSHKENKKWMNDATVHLIYP